MNILVPLGRKIADPGLYLDVVNSSRWTPMILWSAGGVSSGFVVGMGLSILRETGRLEASQVEQYLTLKPGCVLTETCVEPVLVLSLCSVPETLRSLITAKMWFFEECHQTLELSSSFPHGSWQGLVTTRARRAARDLQISRPSVFASFSSIEFLVHYLHLSSKLLLILL